ncbi:MAG: hypothetical protein AAFX79_04020 [Planctomycetota bacterium]
MPEPTSARPWTDAFTLLCERCGYVLDGIGDQAACPECGTPIARSLPAARIGTAWQRAPSAGALLRTWSSALRRPHRTLDAMAFDRPPRSTRRLRRATLAVAGLLTAPTIGTLALLILERPRRSPTGGMYQWSPGSVIGAMMLALVLAIPAWLACGGVYAALTHVEARGLVLFGRQRHARVDRIIADTIVAHGAAGWVVAAAGLALCLPFLWTMQLDVSLAQPAPFMSLAWRVLAYVGVGVALAGFLLFEVFAWLGLRRCKFANRSRPGSAADEQKRAG